MGMRAFSYSSIDENEAVAIAYADYCLSKLHFNIFDSLFLARGKLARLLNLGNK
jgi:hypothetical protein